MAIRHVVMLTFTAEMTDADRDALAAGLATLPEAIPDLRDYRFGPDLGLAPDNAGWAVVADFDDVDGYLTYRDHPAHREVISRLIAPFLAARTAVQFPWGD